MQPQSYDLGIPVEDLEREARRAVEGWDWRRGAWGHALSLPRHRDLHPYHRFSYQNFPCTGLLDELPLFRRIFDELECDKVSFRLLRRGPSSSYSWHTDKWKGPGVVRFQVPLLTTDEAYLVTTDYTSPDQVVGPRFLTDEAFDDFARANEGHFAKHHLEPAKVQYFDTTRVHTLVNPGTGDRITLSFDLVANDWLLERFPAARAELGDGPIPEPPRPGPVSTAVAFARTRLYPLRNRLRSMREAHA